MLRAWDFFGLRKGFVGLKDIGFIGLLQEFSGLLKITRVDHGLPKIPV